MIIGPGGISAPQDLLFVVKGNTNQNNVQTSGGSNNLSVLDLGLVDLTGDVQLSPGVVNGEIIDGGKSVQLVSGTGINTPSTVPEPGSLLLLGTGLCSIAGLSRKRLLRK